MKFDQDFKDAIAGLPTKEKDKLLVRLLKKDIPLANQLYFQLIESRSKEERRKEVEYSINRELYKSSKHLYSAGILLMYLRELSGRINEHVATTKDKYGEPYLNCYMLTNGLKINREELKKFANHETQKLYVYTVARIFKILTQVNVFHEDLKYDFKEFLRELANEIEENESLMKMSNYHGLDINWLIRLEIPNNIIEIQKDLRKRGYLK